MCAHTCVLGIRGFLWQWTDVCALTSAVTRFSFCFFASTAAAAASAEFASTTWVTLEFVVLTKWMGEYMSEHWMWGAMANSAPQIFPCILDSFFKCDRLHANAKWLFFAMGYRWPHHTRMANSKQRDWGIDPPLLLSVVSPVHGFLLSSCRLFHSALFQDASAFSFSFSTLCLCFWTSSSSRWLICLVCVSNDPNILALSRTKKLG